MSTLEQIWEYREEVIYPRLFGSSSRGVFVLSYNLFKDMFSVGAVDPRWLHHGVIEYGPTQSRDTWIYITTAASNPWDVAPEDYTPSASSGLGTELVFEVPSQSDWAIVQLQRLLAFNLLLADGRFGKRPTLNYGDRIPLQSPITLSGDSCLRNILVIEPSHYESSFQLDSGIVKLLHLVGISDCELQFGKRCGSGPLTRLLTEHDYAPVTRPHRQELENSLLTLNQPPE